jgi:hypothetical protein
MSMNDSEYLLDVNIGVWSRQLTNVGTVGDRAESEVDEVLSLRDADGNQRGEIEQSRRADIVK